MNGQSIYKKIVISDPSPKLLDYIQAIRKEKEQKRQALLEKKEHTFSIQI